jgi:cellulose synthase/poly-beta-1,6-N-acetylglucosamine synthase-like glycosyltransferase
MPEPDKPVIEPPLLSVIVPVCDGRPVLERCLTALVASDLPRELWELVIVDDGSLDGTALLAAGWADVLVRLPGPPHGPAYARNRGVEASIGSILVFLDADVCLHPDALRRIAWTFAHQPGLGAVFGSYDANPPERDDISQYRNLRHHYVHQREAGRAETFWAACGAVRRRAFLEAGRFDEWHFPRPQIEDVELGYRLRELGWTIMLDPTIQGTHLKRWRLREVLIADLRDRGVAWIRLQLALGAARRPGTLLFRRREWVRSALVTLAALLLLVSAIPARRGLAWVAVALLGAVLLSNARLYRFFVARRGLVFAFRILPVHLLYYLLNGVGAIYAWITYQLVGGPAPPAEIQAYAETGLKRWPPLPARVQLAARPAHTTPREAP